MARNGEWELKFELDGSRSGKDGSAAWLPASLREAEPRTLETTYYDTPKSKLRRRNAVLRVRKSGDTFLQTIKQDEAGNFARGEWEQETARLRRRLAHAGRRSSTSCRSGGGATSSLRSSRSISSAVLAISSSRAP